MLVATFKCSDALSGTDDWTLVMNSPENYLGDILKVHCRVKSSLSAVSNASTAS